MSAPSIPNLFSLRGASRGGRGRGRGRGGGPGSAAAHGHDVTIQGTDTDAAVSRLSAVELGYLDDAFAQYFVQSSQGPPSRRLPIINRGTYTRTTALDKLIDLFLTGADEAGSKEKQIISLGAGTDTRSLRLFSNPARRNITYHEIDFPAICTKKFHTIKGTPVLRRVLQNPTLEEDGSSWHSQAENDNLLWFHGLDLRDIARQSTESATPLALKGLRTDIPTLLISECCLCYLETPAARATIAWFQGQVASLGIVLYEPVKPDDPFGRMMVSNLAARRIRMPTLETFKEPADQETRLREAGFEAVRAMTVDQIWERWVHQDEKERVDGLEGLDEVEEWKLLAGHYVVAWGWKGHGFEGWAG
ncbi:leucine carboxyl methyltransferase [Thozetella sp. PMI_491]|nr:leucine carboxyl methyltransferase [Thozetella sp. PMI_491]